ncbi:MAG: hemJ [Gammaproteobacteria bacterium]|jgi:putative membrane protein|nr:hemJ [Gammaproteobacteria bacterium]
MLRDWVYSQVSMNAYHWIMAIHIIGVVCWFSGLFYLPRLFVYHAMAKDKTSQDNFKIMEYKLNYFIMHPAMAVSLISGIFLMHFYFIRQHLIPTWLLSKLVLVLILFIYQMFCGHYIRAFKADRNVHSHKFYRFFNEIPSILLVAIVILVVVKPFTGGWVGIDI